MSKFLQFLIFVVFTLSVGTVVAQKTWVGPNNGTWNTAGNWSPSGVPGAGDNVVISNSHNINININATINRLTITGNVAVTFTANGAARTITIDDTGSSIDTGSSLTLVGTTGGLGTRTMGLAFTGSNETMSIAGTLNLTATAAGSIYNATNSVTTVTGSIVRTGGTITSTNSNLSFSSGGLYQHAMNGSTIPTATWNAASTCLVSGITTTIPSAGLGQSFGNFTWNCTGQTAAINNLAGASGGLTTINGNFTVSSTNGQTLNLNNSGTLHTMTVGGNFINSGGTIDFASGTQTTTVNVGGTIEVTNAAVLTTTSGTASVVNGTFVLTGSSPQTVTYSTPTNVTYTNLTVNNTRALIMGSNIILSRHNNAPFRGIITINSGGIINCGTFVVDGGGLVETNGNFILNSGAKMITANATGVQGSVNTTNVNPTYSSGASYEFRGAATGVFTLSTANTITGTMTINRSAGVTLDQDFTTSTLEFLDGVATTGSFAITIPLTGSITGANASRYVNGRLNKVFNSATSFTYPIGKGGVYKPVVYEYTALTGTSTVAVEQFEAALPGTLPSSVNLNNSRYWEISQTGGSSIGYKVTLDGTGDAVTGTVIMLKRESGTTASHAVTAPNYTNTTAFTTLTGNNQFTLGSNCTQTASVGSNQSFCSPEAVVLSGNTPTYGSGAWSVSGPSTSLAQFSDVNAPTATFTPAGGNGIYTLTWTVTNGNCSITANQDLEYGKTTTWTSASGGSWSNGIPDATTSAIISFDYTSSGDLVACSMTVNSTSDVIISAGDTVSLTGSLTVDSGSSFTLENNANLLQEENINNNSGAIIVKRNSSALLRQDYTLWSAPVAGQNLLNFSPSTLTTRFYTYSTTANQYSSVVPSTTNFANATGYLIRMPNNHPTTPTVWAGAFEGVPNNGDYTFTMTDNGVGQRFNAVGNPYPSPLDAVDFVSNTTNAANTTGTLYFWRKTNNAASPSYCSWTTGGFVSNSEAQVFDPNDVLRTGQGFFVEASGNGTTLEFNNTMRIDDHANQFFRMQNTAERHRIWLNATNADGLFSQTLVGYMTNATNDLDYAIDGKHINDGAIALTSLINDETFVIQGRSLPFDTTDIVPLQFKATSAGSYTIAIDHVDGLFSESQPIYLRDLTRGVDHNLKVSEYNFTSDSGTFSNRFEIVYESTLSVSNPVLENAVVVYSKNKTIEINSGSVPMNNVKIFDMRGRLVAEQNDVMATTISIPLERLANQVLIVQLTAVDGQTLSKKVVH